MKANDSSSFVPLRSIIGNDRGRGHGENSDMQVLPVRQARLPGCCSRWWHPSRPDTGLGRHAVGLAANCCNQRGKDVSAAIRLVLSANLQKANLAFLPMEIGSQMTPITCLGAPQFPGRILSS